MPSCRHSERDSKKQGMTCGNGGCDGSDGIPECRHNQPQPAPVSAESRLRGHAVTCLDGGRLEISAPHDDVTVRLPAELPTLAAGAARALLAILVELTEVPVLDPPEKGTRDDS